MFLEDKTPSTPPIILTKKDNYLNQIVIDSDDQLDEEWKKV